MAEHIENCNFEIKTVNNKQRLITTVKISGKQRITEYALLSEIISADSGIEYIDVNGDKAIIPEGFTVSKAPGESTVDKGLVIYLINDKTDVEIETINWEDSTTLENLKTNYDQFVWIPIARENINDMYMCQSEDGTKSCKITVQEVNEEEVAYCTTHESTQMAGRLYATAIGENFTIGLTSQTYTANSGLREPDVVTGTDGKSYDNNTEYLGYLNGILGTSLTSSTAFKTYLQEEYNEIVKSVYENEGFYVGRYETSNITTEDGNSIEIRAGVLPGTTLNWYYMYAQQKDYATNKGLTDVVGSTMIQGAAYDQVLKFVDTNSYVVTSTGNALHNKSYTDVPWQTAGLNYTDKTEYNDVSKNIYDMEGNVCVRTTEAYGTSSRVYRGGTCYASNSASYRDIYSVNYGGAALGSMVLLYLK